MSAAFALRAAIHVALGSDAELALPVFDEVPRGTAPPYLLLGLIETRDASAGEAAEEHLLQIEAWSAAGGAREALLAAARIRTVLEGGGLVLAGWRLANLRVTATETRREAEGRHRRAVLKIRAVTEAG